MMKYSGGITLDNLQTIENEAQSEIKSVSDTICASKPVYDFLREHLILYQRFWQVLY